MKATSDSDEVTGVGKNKANWSKNTLREDVTAVW